MSRFSRLVDQVNKNVPNSLRPTVLSLLFGSQVKFARTAGIRIESLSSTASTVQLKNRKKIQNHIGSPHAAATALLAETATGIVFGMNVPDSHVPVIKSMKINYVARAKGSLTAHATLKEEQIQVIKQKEKGDVLVEVSVVDEEGKNPVTCEMVWAWTPKRR
eukprot:TRINITY_DN223_c0_g1_i1.p1 TRINITY_DN223_c0_g1~~TRINITY_DN223_c0_g1_i1.p1  ORF type:complete len:162 (+),score=31.46 TRINITY_DN223_c0_g1_i1:51-536(+)